MMRNNEYSRLVVERNASVFHLSTGTSPTFRVGGVTAVNDQILTNANSELTSAFRRFGQPRSPEPQAFSVHQ
jgi:hypothetical protein